MHGRLLSAISFLLISGITTQSASATDDFIVDTSPIGHSQNGTIVSEQLLELGSPNSRALRLEGEQSIRFGNMDRAIMVLQRAVELEPKDLEGRLLYAEALEKKLRHQKERDPKLYNYVIKQWLFITKRAEFQDQVAQAQNHLMNLTGSRPGRFERASKFLSRVMVPEDGSTTVAFGKHNKPQQ